MFFRRNGKTPARAQILETAGVPTYLNLGISYEVLTQEDVFVIRHDKEEPMWIYKVRELHTMDTRFIFSPFELPQKFWVRALTNRAIRPKVLEGLYISSFFDMHYEILSDVDDITPIHELRSRAPTLEIVMDFKTTPLSVA